ncbi:conserved hypothetical protein [Talaromyces stipitatus ATCC 10500]|uniref:HTH CENPB-type domain-containing protein n=1 Tax=Talaromyces stipitatus (strain ATCC 10500 / CBS 375.48 / QM 6759 / NRRL 1006) TaxID=441959 RepID=B8LV18_TALSN|nr:uncharacterized protein TSTA_061300 [Talaromyces stipitatus ATCC 10500]EED22639.1 conserved hypothetical protein [Talaromyces stipitatus ATCC 10500]
MTPKLYKEEEALIAKALARANTKEKPPNFSKLAHYMGTPPTNQQIEESANYLLAKDFTGPGEPPRAGKTWVYNFVGRLPEKYVRIVQKPQEKEPFPKTSKRVSSLSSRESITIVEGVSAKGKIIPPLLIPKGKVHLEEWYRHLQDDEWLQYKHVHGRVVNKVARLGGFDFDKNDFFEELRDIRIKTFTTRTIRNGWRERGIWPLNPQLILDKMSSPEEAFEAMVAEGDTLKIYGEAYDTIPSSPTTKSISPPSTVIKLRRYINKIEKSIDSIKDILDGASPGLSKRIKTVNQGSLTLAELGNLHRESFAKVRETAERKNQKSTRRHVKASGALYVKDANRLIKRRHDGDLLRIHKSHVLGVLQPEEEEAPTEPQNYGFFFDTQGPPADSQPQGGGGDATGSDPF